MANSPAQKAIVIGCDGASMELVGHMVDRGHCPNIKHLIDEGVYREMLGVVPTLTPPGWTTLATGAWAGTHKVADFNIRNYESYIPDSIWGINTDLCQAELIWNTAERCGRIPILVKQEISWPPTIEKGIQVEGSGPGVSNYHQLAGYHLFVTAQYRGYQIGGEKDPERVDPSALQTGDQVDRVRVVPAGKWQNAPASTRPLLEVELVIKPLHRGQPRMLRGRQGTPKPYYGLIYAQGDAYDTLLVAPDRDAAHAFARLREKQWAAWWLDWFEIDGESLEGSVRCKLMVLSPDGQHIELFFPQIWPTSGDWCFPARISEELTTHVGPFIQNPARDAQGVIDDETYFEVLQAHFECLAATSRYLLTKYPWDLHHTETHASDYGNHFFLRLADPLAGAPADVRERSYRGLVRTYELIDWWVGQLMEMRDDDTVLLLVSDHGGTPDQHGRTSIEDVLEGAGLLVYKIDPKGEKVIDWSKTKACPLGICNIFVNLEEREPEGIVALDDYFAVQKEIIAALYEYTHPATGEHPFALALTRDDAEMLNLWGELVGDVVFVLRPEYDAAHGQQMPSAKLGIGAQHALFVMAGAGVKKGVHLAGQVRQVDVAPTVSYLLGMDVPRDAEGGVVYEALQDPNWHLAEIRRLSREG